MHIEQRRIKFLLLSLVVALVIAIPITLLLSSVLGAAIFGAVCLMSFLLFSNKFPLLTRQGLLAQSPIILGVIIGLAIQVSGSLPYTGGGTIIFFTGVGAMLAMLARSIRPPESASISISPN